MGYILWLNFMVMGLCMMLIRHFINYPDKAVNPRTPHRDIKYKLMLWTLGVFAALNGLLGLYLLVHP